VKLGGWGEEGAMLGKDLALRVSVEGELQDVVREVAQDGFGRERSP
jgi:hypothetical protein